MQFKQLALVAALSLPLVLSGCFLDGDTGPQGEAGVDGTDGLDGTDGVDGIDGVDGTDGSDGIDATASTIALTFLGRYSSGIFDESAAEIVDFDPTTARVFVVNADSGEVDILDASSPSVPTFISSLDVVGDVASDQSIDESTLSEANSVAVMNGVVAVALAADPSQDPGYVALYQTDGTFVKSLQAGALPDMLTFTPDGNKILVANEGEPSGDYTNDPEGSVSVVDMSSGAAAATISQISFAGVDIDDDVRISARAASVAADLEPEYIAVAPDGSSAYVMLQENNAVAIIDLATDTIESVASLGFKNYSIPGNEFDASNEDGGANIRNWPVYGVYMPDAADAYEVNGVTYVITANEGDGREYDDYLDEIRIKDIGDDGATIDSDLQERAGNLFDEDYNLGRLKIITDLGTDGVCASLATTGQPEADCEYEAFYSFGARSFTIWNAETGVPVYDSGNEFEVITANRYPDNFNASNDDNEGDDRSDDKGPEPEAIEIATIEGRTYAFIGLERVGGIMVYNVSNPEAAEFVQYINERDFSSADVEDDLATVGDLGPESIKFVSAEDSPTANPFIIVGNEVSGTTSFFEVNIVVQ